MLLRAGAGVLAMHRGPNLRYATPLERNRLIGRALEMRAAGMQGQAIADALGVDRRTICYWTNPESAAKSRARARVSGREARKAARKRERDLLKQHTPHMAEPRPPEADYLARLAEIPPDTRTTTARICGDPLPGRSALDRRG